MLDFQYIHNISSPIQMRLCYADNKNNSCYVGQVKLSFLINLINSIIEKQHTIR
jgi:hypothetical protein